MGEFRQLTVRVDDEHRLVLPEDLAQQLRSGEEITIQVHTPDPEPLARQENPFLQVMGTLPPLPGGAVEFVRDLRGHDE
ncbi:hypothetical protein DVJ83_17925 (plasmid) [Deinococcus wulumuqiensis]|uniref:Uncharacterized protein n=1 Tax=Deinococcus wulumuqiensis TaxID=980427 RepID=A0A345IMQ4_9DEIO|nr:hypothetical protein [Deinococcus wulumuqiensis]AXH00977.1 hypothetical protein DVJ83_17925 [Deinococcus wulumuqiensis]